MGFKPVPMTKIRVTAYRERAHSLLTLLHDLKSIQFEEVTDTIRKNMKVSTELQDKNLVIDLLNNLRGMENLLPPVKVNEKIKFTSLEEVIESAKSIKIGEDIKIAVNSISDIRTELKSIENRMKVLEVLKSLDLDMECFNNSAVSSYIINGEYDGPLNKDYIVNKAGDKTIVTIPKNKEREFAQSVGSDPGRVTYVMEMNGKPKEIIEKLTALEKDAEEKIADIQDSLKELSIENYAKIVSTREALEIEAKKIEAAMKMPSSESIFVMEGWVPAPSQERVIQQIEKETGELCIVEVIKTDEIGPTLQKHSKRFKLYESFIRFYSLPEDVEIDPTIFFAIAFPIFFGIMVGDWGFGIIILILSLWLTKRINSNGTKRKLPKKLSNFVTSIFSPYQLQILARAMLPGAIVAIIAGVVFNGFFGFAILPTHIGPLHITYFSPIIYTSKILLLTGFFGVFMVSFGFVLGIINDYYYNHKKMIIGHIGWLLFVWGIVIYGLSLIYKQNLSLSNPYAVMDIVAMIVGVIMIVTTEKGIGLIELPSVISHVLSYLRIMGILLASVILTQLVNSFFLSTLSDPILIVFGVILLVIGQIFALLLAVVESGIQGVRLLYVEFFSKFYKGNGKAFTPFGTKRKYTEEKFQSEKV